MAFPVRPADRTGPRPSPVGTEGRAHLAGHGLHRNRRALALVGSAVALALVGTLAPAHAATPELRRRQVQQQLADTRRELDGDSSALAAATVRVRRAEALLPPARAALAQAQGELLGARARDAAAQAKLAAAEQALADAERRVDRLSARITRQRERMGRIAAGAYRGSGMSGLAFALASSADPGALSDGLSAVQSVMRSQHVVVTDLGDDRARLANARAALDGLRDVADRQRVQAAEWLDRTRRLEAAAAQRATEVARLVAERRAALAAARQAQAVDLRRYDKLRTERNRINRLIKERIRRERARQARLARLRAARERAAEARARRAAAAQHRAYVPRSVASSGAILARPVYGVPITSPYGMRVHPITHVYKLHDGTDFGASCGTPVRAARAGAVVWASYHGAYGNQVLLDHGWVHGRSLMTSYSHLRRYATHSGAHVATGQVIGYVGTTGYSTGCHLHFMVYRDGGTVDPMNYL